MSDTSLDTLDQETPELSPEEQRKAQLAAKSPVLTGSGAILKSLELLGIKDVLTPFKYLLVLVASAVSLAGLIQMVLARRRTGTDTA